MAILLACLHCGDFLRSQGDPPKKCYWCEQRTCWLTSDDVRWLRVNRIRLGPPEVGPLMGSVES